MGRSPILALALSCRYFTSRPDLLSRIGGDAGAASEPTSGSAITAAAQRAITKNPAAASRFLAAGINHASSSNGASTGNNAAITAAAQRAITKNPAATSRLLVAGINHANNSGSGNSNTAAGNDDLASAYNPGRVAAAAHAFSGPPKSTSPPVAQKGPDANKLVPQKVSSVVFVFVSTIHSLTVILVCLSC